MGFQSIDGYFIAHYYNKNTILVCQKNETICRLKLLLNEITQCCDYIEEVTNITNIHPNNYSEYLASLNKSSISFNICDISLPQDQTGSVYFVMPQKEKIFFLIGCL